MLVAAYVTIGLFSINGTFTETEVTHVMQL